VCSVDVGNKMDLEVALGVSLEGFRDHDGSAKQS
jgi:hypothetical protein